MVLSTVYGLVWNTKSQKSQNHDRYICFAKIFSHLSFFLLFIIAELIKSLIDWLFWFITVFLFTVSCLFSLKAVKQKSKKEKIQMSTLCRISGIILDVTVEFLLWGARILKLLILSVWKGPWVAPPSSQSRFNAERRPACLGLWYIWSREVQQWMFLSHSGDFVSRSRIPGHECDPPKRR